MSNDEFIPIESVQVQTNDGKNTNPIKDIENEKTKTNTKKTVKFICTKTKRGNFTAKKKQNFLNSDNSYKEALKASILMLFTFIKEIFNIQLKRINLRKIVKSIKKNKLLFNYKLYQILCVDKNNQNKNILLKFKEKNENYKKLYFYLLTRKFKDLFDNYYKNNNRIKMSSNGKDMEIIDSFPTFNNALIKKVQYYKKKYNAEKINKKIDEFKTATDIIFHNFKGHTGRPERNQKEPCKEHEKEIIKDFDNFDLEKYISIEFSSTTNESINIESKKIENPNINSESLKSYLNPNSSGTNNNYFLANNKNDILSTTIISNKSLLSLTNHDNEIQSNNQNEVNFPEIFQDEYLEQFDDLNHLDSSYKNLELDNFSLFEKPEKVLFKNLNN